MSASPSSASPSSASPSTNYTNPNSTDGSPAIRVNSQLRHYVIELHSNITRLEGVTSEQSRYFMLAEEQSALPQNLVQEIESTCEETCTKLHEELDRFKKETTTQIEKDAGNFK